MEPEEPKELSSEEGGTNKYRLSWKNKEVNKQKLASYMDVYSRVVK